MPFIVPRVIERDPPSRASARKESKGDRGGNGVKSYEDQHGQERHQHGPDPVGKGKVIKTDD